MFSKYCLTVTFCYPGSSVYQTLRGTISHCPLLSIHPGPSERLDSKLDFRFQQSLLERSVLFIFTFLEFHRFSDQSHKFPTFLRSSYYSFSQQFSPPPFHPFPVQKIPELTEPVLKIKIRITVNNSPSPQSAHQTLVKTTYT